MTFLDSPSRSRYSEFADEIDMFRFLLINVKANYRNGESRVSLSFRALYDDRYFYLIEVNFFAKELCSEAMVEAILKRLEERTVMYISPPGGLYERQIEELEGKIAERGVDILVETGILLGLAVDGPDT